MKHPSQFKEALTNHMLQNEENCPTRFRKCLIDNHLTDKYTEDDAIYFECATCNYCDVVKINIENE